jgi:hypothetical protein
LSKPSAYDLSLVHVQAELARIDARVQREIRRWQLAGQDTSDEFRGLKISDAEAQALAERPFATSWGQSAVLSSDETQRFKDLEAAAERGVQAAVKRARREGQTLRLEELATRFGLDRFELDAFLICLAPQLDLRYERLYGYLQDDVTRRRASVDLVLNLLCEPGPERLLELSHFSDQAPLLKHSLLEVEVDAGRSAAALLSRTLTVDEAVVRWLLGEQRAVGPGSHMEAARPSDQHSDAVLAGARWEALQQALGGREAAPVIVFYGPDTASQQACTRLFAAQQQQPLLTVDLTRAAGSADSVQHAVQLAIRDALLHNAIPCIFGWDVCLAASMPPALLPALMGDICNSTRVVIIIGQSAWQAQGFERTRTMLWLDFPVPDYAHRLSMWQHLLAGVPTRGRGDEATLSAEDIEALAGQFVLTATQIRDAVASASDWAAQRGETPGAHDLFRAARSHSSPGLANLAHKIEPRFSWDDIVLPADQLEMLHEIIATVRGRPTVLEGWGLGGKLASSRGVTVLFAGPPGTGKTMAAEVVAARLQLDLYKIDLSTVVNKYIGETEKNLGRIFDEAANSNAILFFDEADAIFGKRSEVKDAHDRYANIEVSYLLQRMETYDGVTVLATNLRANLDDAFTRRLHFAIDFPFPDDDYRRRIWQALFPPELPCTDDIDLDLLARRYKLAGGNIRNIIVSAAYLAAADGGRLTMPHLLHGARRELQKMGRLVKETETNYG